MKYVVIFVSLILTTHCFADQNEKFETAYLKIMEASYMAQLKEYRFNRIHETKQLSPTEQLEAKNNTCEAMQNELAFYTLVSNRFEEYVDYMRKNGLNVSPNAEKLHEDYRSVKEKFSDSSSECE